MKSLNEFCGSLPLIALLALVGCGRANSPTPLPQSQLSSALQIVEWEISEHVGHTIRVEGVGAATGKCEITVKRGVRLVTQEKDETHFRCVVPTDGQPSNFVIPKEKLAVGRVDLNQLELIAFGSTNAAGASPGRFQMTVLGVSTQPVADATPVDKLW